MDGQSAGTRGRPLNAGANEAGYVNFLTNGQYRTKAKSN